MNLKPKGLAAGREAYLRAVRSGSDPTQVTEAVVRAYLSVPEEKEDRALKLSDHRLSSATRTLASMKVHQTVTIAPRSLQTLRRRFKSVGKLLNNPNISFSYTPLPSGKIEVTRLPDGTYFGKDFKKGAKAHELASLKQGESIISKTLSTKRNVDQMASSTKASARKLLSNPNADWTTETTPDGLRLTRLLDKTFNS